jgi:hypothetical protein
MVSLFGMTVEEAYKAIPHQRTVFNPSNTTLPKEEAVYLQNFFSLVDQGILEKMETLAYLNQHGKIGKMPGTVSGALSRLDVLSAPKKLAQVHLWVQEAIREQKAYLEILHLSIKNGQPHSFDSGHALVRSSSQKLHAAYNGLMSLYVNENSHNKQAFFNYLCALDFI